MSQPLIILASTALLALCVRSFRGIVKGYRVRGSVPWLAAVTFALAAVGAILTLHALLSP
ncbi:MAG TPA: hypothetical protein ENO03_07885 [Candidatus Aminicenantes bacterium]|nr:hypothetical protein [Candidatus Aminicenantes bacterium]HDT14259.1 hypothetical protein [Candidatus Aminicenantes bacterium]